VVARSGYFVKDLQ